MSVRRYFDYFLWVCRLFDTFLLLLSLHSGLPEPFLKKVKVGMFTPGQGSKLAGARVHGAPRNVTVHPSSKTWVHAVHPVISISAVAVDLENH